MMKHRLVIFLCSLALSIWSPGLARTAAISPAAADDRAEMLQKMESRAPHFGDLSRRIWARIIKCAEAGALATETRMEMELVNSVYNLLPNDALTTLFDRNLRRVGGVHYSGEEQAFAEKLRQSFPTEQALPLGSQEQIQTPDEGYSSGSTDVGDVSWILPTAQFTTATFVPGTPGHSWQSAACAGMNIGRKGMVVAAKTLALTAVDLLTDAKQVAAARASFDKRRAGHEYRSRLPASQKPPLNYRDKALPD